MERVHYRRYKPSTLPTPQQESVRWARQTPPVRPARPIQREALRAPQPAQHEKNPGEEGGFAARLFTQVIICALFLAAVLALRLVDHPQALVIRSNLSQAISGQISPARLIEDMQGWLGIEEASPYIEEPGYTDGEDLKFTTPAPIAPPEL